MHENRKPAGFGSIDIVIVGYRRYDLLNDLIASLLESTVRPQHVIVVDNECDHDQLERLLAAHPEIIAVRNAENRGFAAAANQGLSLVQSEFVLFVNPDVRLEAETIDTCLQEFDESERIGIVTCRLELPGGSLDHACHRGFPTPAASFAYLLRLHRLFPRSKWAGRYTLSSLDRKTSHDIEACSGAFLMVRSDLVRQLGGWDERFPFYAEDVDLCLRVVQSGRRIRYVADARAIHYKSSTSHVRDKGQLPLVEGAIRARVKGEIVRSHRAFFEKHYARRTNPLLRSAVRTFFSAQAAYVYVKYRSVRVARADTSSGPVGVVDANATEEVVGRRD